MRRELGVLLLLMLLLSTALAESDSGAKRFRVAVIGDRTGGANDSAYTGILAEIARMQPDIAVTVGDQIEGYTEDTLQMKKEWEEYLAMVKDFPAKIYYTPGNHDITTEAMEEMYRRYQGEPYYSFDYEGRHFVIVDNSPGWGGPAYEIDEEQLKWLESDLKAQSPEKQILVFMHKPTWYENAALGKPDKMHDLFVKYHVEAVFTGHYHSYFVDEIDGVVYTGVGSSGGGMEIGPTGIGYHFCWVTVDDTITITPINGGAVRPWDDLTSDEYRLANLIRNRSVIPQQPVFVNEELAVPTSTFSMEVSNLSETASLTDTLEWTNAEGWQIYPARVPLFLDPGATTTVEFEAVCSANPFSAPQLVLNAEFAEGKVKTVKQPPRVARKASCVKSKKVKIDGKLDEDCWTSPVTVLLGYDRGPALVDSTWFYFAYDKKGLCVAARCFDAKPENMRAEVTERDGAIYSEDCVGFFFHAGKDTVYQVYMNPLGTVFDQRITFKEDGWYSADPKFDGDYEVEAVRDGKYWIIEARIPYSVLGAKPQSGDTWDLNFRRKQKRLNLNGDWQPIYYYPHYLGLLSFM